MPDYPIIPVKNTTIISNLFFVPEPIAYPKDAYSEFFDNFNSLIKLNNYECNIVEAYKDIIDTYIAVTEKAVEKKPRLLWINLNIPDIFFHRCLNILINNNRKDIKAKEYTVFQGVDRIAKLLGDAYDNLIIISDHGFNSYNKIFSVNSVLFKYGFVTKTPKRTFRKSFYTCRN